MTKVLGIGSSMSVKPWETTTTTNLNATDFNVDAHTARRETSLGSEQQGCNAVLPDNCKSVPDTSEAKMPPLGIVDAKCSLAPWGRCGAVTPMSEGSLAKQLDVQTMDMVRHRTRQCRLRSVSLIVSCTAEREGGQATLACLTLRLVLKGS